MRVLGWMLAADEGAGDLFIKYGPVAGPLILWAILSGKLHTPREYEQVLARAVAAEDRAARYEAKVDAMVDLFRTEVTPALVQATALVASAANHSRRGGTG